MTQTQEKTTTTLKSHMMNQAIYNHWANETLINFLKTKPSDLLMKEVQSSYSSIRKTLLHIWNVELCWLEHLAQVPEKTFRWGVDFEDTIEEIFEGILDTSERIMDFVWSLAEDAIEGGCFFSLPYVGDHTLPNVDVLLHTLNHSTYHRGQVVTIGRSLGFTDAPMTDYMFYLLRVKHVA